MDDPQDDIFVRHNPVEGRFEARVRGELCVAEYVRRDGELVMTHTFVPPALRGRGIAERIVRAALEYAQREGLRIVPACSYVAAYIRRHAEFQPLVSGR